MNWFACHANTEKVSSKMNEWEKILYCIFEILINIIFTLQFKSVYQNIMVDSMTNFFEKNIVDINQESNPERMS